MDNRMRRARLNAGSTLLHQLVSTACGIVIPWIMINQFGSEAYGATTSIAQFLAYITLFEGGVGRVARGALYAPLATGDEERISGIYLSVKRFFRILGIGFMGYALILAIFIFLIRIRKQLCLTWYGQQRQIAILLNRAEKPRMHLVHCLSQDGSTISL